jgi:hypothetical protein
MLVAVAAVLYSCESSGFYAMFLFVYLGVSVVAVNILGHRCVQDHTPLSGLGPVDFAFLFLGLGPLLPFQVLDGESRGDVGIVSFACPSSFARLSFDNVVNQTHRMHRKQTGRRA